MAVILNWLILGLNYLPDYVAIIRDVNRRDSNILFSRKMLDLLILKVMYSLLDCMRSLPIIVYKKPPIKNYSPITVFCTCSLNQIVVLGRILSFLTMYDNLTNRSEISKIITRLPYEC